MLGALEICEEGIEARRFDRHILRERAELFHSAFSAVRNALTAASRADRTASPALRDVARRGLCARRLPAAHHARRRSGRRPATILRRCFLRTQGHVTSRLHRGGPLLVSVRCETLRSPHTRSLSASSRMAGGSGVPRWRGHRRRLVLLPRSSCTSAMRDRDRRMRRGTTPAVRQSPLSVLVVRVGISLTGFCVEILHCHCTQRWINPER